MLLPCLLAGLRAPHIGTDVNVYVVPVIEEMRSSGKSLLSLLYSEIFVGETNGIFVTTLLYTASRFRNGVFLALFAIEFICLFPVYKVIQKQKYSELLKVLSLLCYYCFFYHLSLNLMKQCMAIAITLWGFELLKKNKHWQYLAMVAATALLVHKTAFLAILVYGIYILTVNRKEMQLDKYLGIRVRLQKKSAIYLRAGIFFALLIGAVAVLLNMKSILLVLIQFKHSYVYQLSHMTPFHLKYSNFLVMAMILAPVLAFRAKLLIKDYKCRFYTYMLLLSALLYQFVGVSPALYRVSLYSMIFVILAVPNFINLFKRKMRLVMTAYYAFIPIVNFMFEVVMNSYADVYPYSMAIK